MKSFLLLLGFAFIITSCASLDTAFKTHPSATGKAVEAVAFIDQTRPYHLTPKVVLTSVDRVPYRGIKIKLSAGLHTFNVVPENNTSSTKSHKIFPCAGTLKAGRTYRIKHHQDSLFGKTLGKFNPQIIDVESGENVTIKK